MLLNEMPEQKPTLLKGTQQNPAPNHLKYTILSTKNDHVCKKEEKYYPKPGGKINRKMIE